MVTQSKVHWMESRLLLGPSLPVSLFLLFFIREDKNHTHKKGKKKNPVIIIHFPNSTSHSDPLLTRSQVSQAQPSGEGSPGTETAGR